MFTVTLFELMSGVGCGWLSPTLNSLRNSNSSFSLNVEQCSWIASLHYIGRIIGPLISIPLVDKIGRNNLLILSSFILFSVWIVVWLTRSVSLLYGIRFVFGIAVGILDTIVPIYISENTSPSIRGTFNSLAIAFFFMGELFSFTIITYVEYNTVAIIHSAITFVICLSLFFLKEPAQFLILKGQHRKAEEHFFWLRGCDTDAKKEFEDIKLYLSEQESKFSFELLKNKENCRCLRVTLIANILIFSTGFPAINTLVSLAFSSSETLTSNELTILLGFFQFLSACLSSYIIDKFGRRPLLIIAAGVTIIIHALTASLYYTEEHIEKLPFFAWLIFISITMYAIIFAISMLPLSAIIRGEILPQNTKALGSSLGVIFSSVVSFIVSKVFLLISDSYGIYTNFFFFSLTSFILAVYVYMDMPETKGMTLVDIQKSFRK
ncbi:hypothetical protein PGB90_000586 [Kerria lacca]